MRLWWANKTERHYLRTMGAGVWFGAHIPEKLLTHETVHCAEQHPNEPPDEHRARAIARIVCRSGKVGLNPMVREIRRWGIVLALLMLALIGLSARAHAQYESNIYVITFRDNTGALVHRFAAPFDIKCAAGLTCTYGSNTLTMSASGSSGLADPGTNGILKRIALNTTAIANSADVIALWSGTCDTTTFLRGDGACVASGGGSPPAGADFQVQVHSGSGFGAIGDGVAGQVLISNGAGVAASFQDPIVSGAAPSGSAPVNNPVYMAGDDHGVGCGGNPCIRTPKIDSGGIVQTAVTNSPAVTVTSGSVTATQDTAANLKAEVVFPSAQPVSGTVTANQGTANATPWTVKPDGTSWAMTGTSANVAVTNTPAVTVSSGSITATQGTGTNLHTVVDSGAITVSQGTATNLKAEVVGTGTFAVQAASTLAAETTKVIGTVRNLGNAGAIFDGATAATVPANALYVGGNASGNLTAPIICDGTTIYDTNTNGKTTLVAGSGSKIVYVCGFSLAQSTTSAVTVSLGTGTGAACVTTYTAITPAYPLTAPTSVGPTGIVIMAPNGNGLKTAAGASLCIQTNAAVSVQAIVWYTQI